MEGFGDPMLVTPSIVPTAHRKLAESAYRKRRNSRENLIGEPFVSHLQVAEHLELFTRAPVLLGEV